jgi:uncharacterized protein
MTERLEAVWERWEGHGMERVSVTVGPEGVFADSDLLTPEDVHAHFRVRCDAQWRTQHVEVTVLGEPHRVLRLEANGEGRWADHPELDGCIDVDIYPSPFTNSLPIRRLGEGAETTAAWVQIPELTVEPLHQRYTPLEGGARWRYEALSLGFSTEFEVDVDGLVVDYPELARRMRPHGGQ